MPLRASQGHYNLIIDNRLMGYEESGKKSVSDNTEAKNTPPLASKKMLRLLITAH